MSPNETSTPICYFACHRRNLDEKRRVQIPAKWYRKAEGGKIEDPRMTLILWPHEGQPDMCIQVLPPPVFDKLFGKVTAAAFGNADGQALKRTLGERMEQVDLDAAGRIMVPEGMAAAAGLALGKEAVLNGMFDCFQIWNPERYEATRASVAAKVPKAFESI
jgi:division/cell wall cluster transcriptional repressor MraZ